MSSSICIAAMGLACAFAPAARSVPRIILDTDMRSDCDDAGALGMLHALADAGECEILGVMASTTGPHIVGAIGAINAWYGRPALPVGLYSGHDETGPDDYAPALADTERFPGQVTNESAPDSTALYRRLLHEAPDKSVTVVVIGGQSCVHGLLASEADFEGDGSIGRTGAELISAKVRDLVLMAGRFADGDRGGEWNVRLDIEAAQTVAREWPSPIVYTGFEIGSVIQTGARLTEPEANPVALAYKLYRGTEGGRGVIGNRASWDQTAVYYAVRGLEFEGEPIWAKVGPVRVAFSDEGGTIVEPDTEGAHYYLRQVMDISRTTRIIEDLMVQPPRASGSERQ